MPDLPEEAVQAAAREAVRQIRLDERRRLAKQIREIAEDSSLPPRDLFLAFIERHPNYISKRLTTVISDTLMAVAEEIEQELEEFGEPEETTLTSPQRPRGWDDIA